MDAKIGASVVVVHLPWPTLLEVQMIAVVSSIKIGITILYFLES